VRVNPGNEPERDDTGLPPVDIQIPDDARELDRDVQAYYREQRARRRNQRSRRVHGVLAKDSMMVPLLICCLVFALISGTLLTLFTATSIDQNLPGRSHTGTRPVPAVTEAPNLDSATVAVGGTSYTLSSLGPAVLLVIPAGCSCTAAAGQVASEAAGMGTPAYVLYSGAGAAQAGQLAKKVGRRVLPAQDVTGTLHKGSVGLTAFLVTSEGAVSYDQRLQYAHGLDQLLRAGDVN
jgi:hypothetical protein